MQHFVHNNICLQCPSLLKTWGVLQPIFPSEFHFCPCDSICQQLGGYIQRQGLITLSHPFTLRALSKVPNVSWVFQPILSSPLPPIFQMAYTSLQISLNLLMLLFGQFVQLLFSRFFENQIFWLNPGKNFILKNSQLDKTSVSLQMGQSFQSLGLKLFNLGKGNCLFLCPTSPSPNSAQAVPFYQY